jgi:hypothetical protein
LNFLVLKVFFLRTFFFMCTSRPFRLWGWPLVLQIEVDAELWETAYRNSHRFCNSDLYMV